MRKSFSNQGRLDCQSVENVKLNLGCRDELIPILATLQHVYSQPKLCESILDLIRQDVNQQTRDDRGRQGMDYWQILVLAAVRLGCGLNYDKLQDLAEQHRALRQVMGIGDWEEEIDFNWRRIRDNVCLLEPTTIERISQLIVGEGHRLEPEAPQKVRSDSFVAETNIHYPTESSLIFDGVRKVIELCVLLCGTSGESGWRQHAHLLKKVKQTARQISRIASRKGPNYKERLKKEYRKLLRRTEKILRRASSTCETLKTCSVLDVVTLAKIAELEVFIERTEHVCGTARRRVLEGEVVPNEEKLFSIFEPHTQLYKRGKVGQPVQFGRLVMVYEDAAGFIIHHYILPRDAQDRDVVIEQTRAVQERLEGRIEEASFDRGFHSPENQMQLADIIAHPCLPYWKSTRKEDGSDQWTAHPSGVKATGYLKVEKAGDYTFSLHSHDISRLVVGSEIVVDTDGKKFGEHRKEVKHGTVHLEPGVHPVTLTYLNARQQTDPQRQDHTARGLHVGFPKEFVRSLTAGDIAGIRLQAGALLAEGKREEAKALLIKLHRGGWPLSERDQEYVEQARMRIRRMARTTSLNDRSHALGLIESSLVTYPMLRLDPEFMVSVIAVYANLGDPRAAILADQMLEAEMNDGQRRLLILTQVKVKLNEGDLPGAGQVYRKLKALAPQSEETIEARELIKAAVIRGK